MATLAEVIRARDALSERHRGAPWLRGLGVSLDELGYGLELRAPRPVRGRLNVDPRVPVRIISDAYAPHRVARWRWSGRPAVFDHLDTNGDGVVDEHDLDRGLGHGVSLLRDEAANPVGAEAWQGSSQLFEALDENRDGLVTRADVEGGLGDHAVRLVHGEPAHGPRLPPGSAYGWKGHARWIHFADREAKARYMSKAARHDAEDPILLGWARQFLPLPRHQRAAAILRFAQRCIRYERDPAWYDAQGNRHGIELLDSAATGLHRGYGDCDLKSRIFVALCLACGVAADIDPVFTGDTGFPHVRVRVLAEIAETAGAEERRFVELCRACGVPADIHLVSTAQTDVARLRDRFLTETSGTAAERWETADPTIVNSTIGHLPKKALTAFPREAA